MTRTFEQTHPWISFKIDLERALPRFWIMLGECQSKCEHIAQVPLRPEVARKLHRLYLSKGTLASAAIEGNTLSEAEVLQHLEGKLELPPSREYLKQEVDNIIEACNLVTDSVARREPLPLSPRTIMDLNRLILRNLKLAEEVVPGEPRCYSVVVGRYRGAPSQDCPYLLQSLCDWLNDETFAAPPGLEMSYAFIKAMLAHVYLAWIHPLGDGNGRTARLVEFLILISSGVPAPASHLLSNHYNQTRSEYYFQLDQASRGGGDLRPFLLYAAEGFRDGLKGQLDHIFRQQTDVIWKSHVFNKIPGGSVSAERRRHLAMDLGEKTEPVLISELTNLSPRVIRDYYKSHPKIITRDVEALVGMGLLVKTEAGVRACLEKLQEFMPLKAEGCKSDD